MLSYLVAILAFILFLYNPIIQLLSPGPPLIQRTPRPHLNEDLLALEPNHTTTDLSCPEDSYSVHIVSKEPLVLYIENFLSIGERTHLLEISNPIFEPSTITHDGGATQRETTVRDSEVALVPRTDAVRCVEARARGFQGWRGEQWVERLRVQRYGAGGHYSHHFDWSSSRGGWGRVSSFMAWVGDSEGELEGGGTEFPLLRRLSEDARWCRFVECGDGAGAGAGGEQPGGSASPAGVVFKAVAGNAVYWENFRPDGTGRGHEETWHAGLPVVRGTKVGLNIWTWGRID